MALSDDYAIECLRETAQELTATKRRLAAAENVCEAITEKHYTHDGNLAVRYAAWRKLVEEEKSE